MRLKFTNVDVMKRKGGKISLFEPSNFCNDFTTESQNRK